MLSDVDISQVELVGRDFLNEGRYGPGIQIYNKVPKEKLEKLERRSEFFSLSIWLTVLPAIFCWGTWARYYAMGLLVANVAAAIVSSNIYRKNLYEQHLIDGRGCILWQGVLDDLIPYQDTHPEFVKRTALRLVEDYERWEAMDLVCDERSKQSLHDWGVLVDEFVDSVLKAPTAQLNEVSRDSREWLMLNMASRRELDQIDVTTA